MNREIRVSRCMDCPFMLLTGEDDSSGECLHEHTLIDVDSELFRPAWCPLTGLSVTVIAEDPNTETQAATSRAKERR